MCGNHEFPLTLKLKLLIENTPNRNFTFTLKTLSNITQLRLHEVVFWVILKKAYLPKLQHKHFFPAFTD